MHRNTQEYLEHFDIAPVSLGSVFHVYCRAKKPLRAAWARFAATGRASDSKALRQNKRKLSEGWPIDMCVCADNDAYGRIVKLLLLTGERRRAIGALEWAKVITQGAEAQVARMDDDLD